MCLAGPQYITNVRSSAATDAQTYGHGGGGARVDLLMLQGFSSLRSRGQALSTLVNAAKRHRTLKLGAIGIQPRSHRGRKRYLCVIEVG